MWNGLYRSYPGQLMEMARQCQIPYSESRWFWLGKRSVQTYTCTVRVHVYNHTQQKTSLYLCNIFSYLKVAATSCPRSCDGVVGSSNLNPCNCLVQGFHINCNAHCYRLGFIVNFFNPDSCLHTCRPNCNCLHINNINFLTPMVCLLL